MGGVFSDFSFEPGSLMAGEFVEEAMEFRTMVFYSGMGQFMEYDIIDEVAGEFHQVQVEADVVAV